MTNEEPRDDHTDTAHLDDDEPDLRKIVSANTQAFQRAASQHRNWARAVGANKDLAERLSQTANISSSLLATEVQRIMRESMPDLGLSASSLASRHGLTGMGVVPSAARISMAQPFHGLTAAKQQLNFSQPGLSSKLSSLYKALRPNLEQIQLSLNELNTPAVTPETQTFLTGADGPQYRANGWVWHYTSAEALNNILIQHYLWASSPHHLNDTSELTHGLETIECAVNRAADDADHPSDPAIQTLKEVFNETFVNKAMHEIYYLSASTAPDSLTLWRNYSTNAGFAIGLRPKRDLSPEGVIVDDHEDYSDLDLPVIANWYRVQYSNSKKDALADSFVVSALNDIATAGREDRELVITELRKHLIVLASTMKHEAFKDEREVRWITTNWAPVDVVHYEVTHRGFVPVLHVRTAGSDEEDPHLPIVAVRCSPTSSPTIVRTIQGLLKQRGYVAASADVQKSTMPFRG